MHVQFISDLHLCAQRPDLTRAFVSYLDALPASLNALYILGDFFDAWVGDDDDSDFVAAIAEHLAALTSRHIAVKFVCGNRDFLLGEAYAARAGMELLPEISTLQLGKRRAVILHGDELCTRDEAYMTLRTQLRDPAWQAQLLRQPLAARRALAAQLRAQSKSMSSLKAADIMDVTPAAVEAVLREQQASLMIHGHTHRPARHPLTLDDKACERIVLGDWDTQAWCLDVTENSINLLSWPIEPA